MQCNYKFTKTGKILHTKVLTGMGLTNTSLIKHFNIFIVIKLLNLPRDCFCGILWIETLKNILTHHTILLFYHQISTLIYLGYIKQPQTYLALDFKWFTLYFTCRTATSKPLNQKSKGKPYRKMYKESNSDHYPHISCTKESFKNFTQTHNTFSIEL